MTPVLDPDRRRHGRASPADVLTLVAARHALRCAADELDAPSEPLRLAALDSLVDRLTVERVAGWLRARARVYDAAVRELPPPLAPLADAADELAPRLDAGLGLRCGAGCGARR